MRVDLLPDTIWVRLSARNLNALRVKLNDSRSYKTIVSASVFDADGELIHGMCLAVQAEPDGLHYRNRPAPGVMSPATEEALRLLDHIDENGDEHAR